MTPGSRPDKYALAKQIIAVLEEELVTEGFELLDVHVFQSGGRWQMRVFVDTTEGINLDGCAKASRTVGMLMEEADLFAGEYLVEVTSPGIRRPLRTPAHFIASVDQDVEIKISGGKRPQKLCGRLLAADDRGVTLQVAEPAANPEEEAGDPEITLAYGEILEANLDPKFDVQALINADRRKRKEQKRAERKQRRTKTSRRAKKKRDRE